MIYSQNRNVLIEHKSILFKTNRGSCHYYIKKLSDISMFENEFYNLLNKEEIIRFNRYRFEKDKLRFLYGRGLLRKELSVILKCHARDIEFKYNRYGKPLINTKIHRLIHFNISHSRESLALVFSSVNSVGIDIESVDMNTDINNLLSIVLSEEESLKWSSIEYSKQRELFYNIWVQKEAIIKAYGSGLSYDLKKISLPFCFQYPGERSQNDYDIKVMKTHANEFAAVVNYIR